MKSLKQETLSSTKWSAIEKFSVQGVSFLLGIIMARLLSPSDFGTVALIGIFMAISGTFIDSGFGNALVRKVGVTQRDYSTVFYFNFIISCLCYFVLFLISPWVASFFDTPVLCPILRVQSISLIIGSLMGVQCAMLTKKLDFKALAQRAVLSTLISGIFGVIFAYYGFGVWALVYQGIIGSVLNLIFIIIYCRWFPLFSFSLKSFKELGSYGSKLLAAGLLNTIYDNLTPIVIGKYFSKQDLGYYNRGTSLALYPKNTINGIILKVTFPILAKIQEDESRLISVYRKYIGFSSMCIIFGCTLIFAIGRPLILFLLTSKWEEAIIYLQIFCFSAMFGHIGTINLNLLQVKGRSDLFLRLEIIKKIISVTLLFASIPFGVIAICISKVIYTQITNYINTYYTGKLFNLGFYEQIKDYMPFFIYSMIACTPAYLFCTFVNCLPIVSLIIGFTVSCLLYYLLLRKHPYLIEFLNLIKNAKK